MNFNFFTIILLQLLYFIKATSNSFKNNFNNNIVIRNASFKAIIFKEKKIPKIINYFKNKYQIFYNKAIIKIYEGANEYENLSDEDKQLLDFIFSLVIG